MKLKRSITFFLSAIIFSILVPAMVSAEDLNFTVVFKSSTLPENAAAIVENAGAQVVAEVPEIGLMRIEGPLSLLESLGSDPEIMAISPSVPYRLPAEPLTAMETTASFDTDGAILYNLFQWDIKQVTNDGESFDIWPGSHQTVVGIIDTGINTEHHDLIMNILGGRNFVPDPDTGVVDPDDYEDQNGHGTHCAGSIAGNGLILGVGPNLGIKAYRVINADGGAMIDWITNGMIAAADDGVDVISMSLRIYVLFASYTITLPDDTELKYKGTVADYLAFKRAAQYAASRGSIVVAAAGNETTNITNPADISSMLEDANNEYFEEQGIDIHFEIYGATKMAPGAIAGVVTVSATDINDNPTSYTNYGPGSIDVSAPGGDLVSDPPVITELCLSSVTGGPYAYGFGAGTSMATPKVAAVTALIIDQAKANGESLNIAQVVARLKQSAVDAGKTGHDEYYGFGMVNAVSALEE